MCPEWAYLVQWPPYLVMRQTKRCAVSSPVSHLYSFSSSKPFDFWNSLSQWLSYVVYISEWAEKLSLKRASGPPVCKTVSILAASLCPSSLLTRVWCMKSSGEVRRMAPSHLVLVRVVSSQPSLCSSSSCLYSSSSCCHPQFAVSKTKGWPWSQKAESAQILPSLSSLLLPSQIQNSSSCS